MSADNNDLEVWMRGPVQDVPALLQPVAHTLLQAYEEAGQYVEGLDNERLWIRPGGMASVGFHLQHIIGVVDRLFTYALGHSLSDEQLAYLRMEDQNIAGAEVVDLVRMLGEQVHKAIDQLSTINESELPATRYLGRKRIPTTMIGLLFHAAEHTQRHVGQLLVTVRWVNSLANDTD